MATISTTFAIHALATRYGFNKDEALRFIRQSLADELNRMAATPAPAPAPARAVETAAEPAAVQTSSGPGGAGDCKSSAQSAADSPKPTPRARPTPKPRKCTPPPAESVVAQPAAAPAPAAAASTPTATSTRPEGAGDCKSPTKPKILKPAMQLPFCGKVLADRCQAVSFSYGLYNQCMNAPDKDGKLCKTCHRNANDAGVPKFGFITDRAANPEWTAPDGKRPQRYVQFWSKRLEAKGVTREQVAAEAAKFEFVIPETEWIKPERATRKRKEKTAVAPSSASGSDNDGAAAAPAPPKTKKLTKTKTKSSPAPPLAQSAVSPAPIELAPAEEDGADAPAPVAAAAAAPAADMVQESLASGLAENPYEAETDDEDEVVEVNVSMKQIDHNDGNGPRNALIDTDGNVYCFTTFMADGSQKKVGTFINQVYTASA